MDVVPARRCLLILEKRSSRECTAKRSLKRIVDGTSPARVATVYLLHIMPYKGELQRIVDVSATVAALKSRFLVHERQGSVHKCRTNFGGVVSFLAKIMTWVTATFLLPRFFHSSNGLSETDVHSGNC